jgi:hypothetical protein
MALPFPRGLRSPRRNTCTDTATTYTHNTLSPQPLRCTPSPPPPVSHTCLHSTSFMAWDALSLLSLWFIAYNNNNSAAEGDGEGKGKSGGTHTPEPAASPLKHEALLLLRPQPAPHPRPRLQQCHAAPLALAANLGARTQVKRTGEGGPKLMASHE